MRKTGLAAAAAVLLTGLAPAMAAEGVTPLIAQSCAGCHGQSGDGEASILPIAGYDRDDFIRVWQEFRADARPATIMNRIARGFTDDELNELADYFASLR